MVHMQMLLVTNVEFVDVKAGGTYNNHGEYISSIEFLFLHFKSLS
jgi:hypothetical protein